MAVHYKFKSAKEFDTVPIEGQFISVAKLKEKIVQKLKLDSASDFDLVISNARTDEEYNEEDFLVRENTSVLVRRVPRKAVSAQSIKESLKGARGANASLPLAKVDAPEFEVDHSQVLHTHPVSACITSDEDTKIKEFVDSSALEWMRQTQEGAKGSGRGQGRGSAGTRCTGLGFQKIPSPGYICHRCGIAGHFIQHCPTNGDPSYDLKKVKIPTGIPRTMLVANPDGSYALPNGEVAVLKPNEAAFAKEIDVVIASQVVADVPSELLCPLCEGALQDAVLTSKCCFKSYCDKCIRDVLIAESTCVCGAKNIRADDLLPNKTLRETIDRVLSGVPLTNSESEKPQSQDSTTTKVNATSESPDEKNSEERAALDELNLDEELDYDAEDLNLEELEEESDKTPDSITTKEPIVQEPNSPPRPAEMKEKEMTYPEKNVEVQLSEASKKSITCSDAHHMGWKGRAQNSGIRGNMLPYAVQYSGYWSASQMVGGPYGYNGFLPGPVPVAYHPYRPTKPPVGIMSREEFEARKAEVKRKRDTEQKSNHFRGDKSYQGVQHQKSARSSSLQNHGPRSSSPRRHRSRSKSPYGHRHLSSSPRRHRPRSTSPECRRREGTSPHGYRRRSMSPANHKLKITSPRRDRMRHTNIMNQRPRSRSPRMRRRLSPKLRGRSPRSSRRLYLRNVSPLSSRPRSRSPQRHPRYRGTENNSLSPPRHPRSRGADNNGISPQRRPQYRSTNNNSLRSRPERVEPVREKFFSREEAEDVMLKAKQPRVVDDDHRHGHLPALDKHSVRADDHSYRKREHENPSKHYDLVHEDFMSREDYGKDVVLRSHHVQVGRRSLKPPDSLSPEIDDFDNRSQCANCVPLHVSNRPQRDSEAVVRHVIHREEMRDPVQRAATLGGAMRQKFLDEDEICNLRNPVLRTASLRPPEIQNSRTSVLRTAEIREAVALGRPEIWDHAAMLETSDDDALRWHLEEIQNLREPVLRTATMERGNGASLRQMLHRDEVHSLRESVQRTAVLERSDDALCRHVFLEDDVQNILQRTASFDVAPQSRQVGGRQVAFKAVDAKPPKRVAVLGCGRSVEINHQTNEPKLRKRTAVLGNLNASQGNNAHQVGQKRTAIFLHSNQQPLIQANVIVNRAKKRFKVSKITPAAAAVKVSKNKLCEIPMVKSVFDRISFAEGSKQKKVRTVQCHQTCSDENQAGTSGTSCTNGNGQRVVVFYGDMS